jgi:nicotinamidase-related amidase
MLRFGSPTPLTLHLCIDMQRVYAEDTPWRTPWMARVLPMVLRLAEARPRQTIFSRFMPPHQMEEAKGSWRRYYERWRELTLERADPRLFDLVDELARLVPPAEVVDKRTYSPWTEPVCAGAIAERRPDALVITGAETDVCVLAAVLGAVDRGYRVILPTDALCSSSDATHDALLTLYRQRFSQQIETATTDEILRAWE